MFTNLQVVVLCSAVAFLQCRADNSASVHFYLGTSDCTGTNLDLVLPGDGSCTQLVVNGQTWYSTAGCNELTSGSVAICLDSGCANCVSTSVLASDTCGGSVFTGVSGSCSWSCGGGLNLASESLAASNLTSSFKLRGTLPAREKLSSNQTQANLSIDLDVALAGDGPPAGCTLWIEIQPNQDNSCSALAASCGIDLGTLYRNNGNLQGGNSCNVIPFGNFVCCAYR